MINIMKKIFTCLCLLASLLVSSSCDSMYEVCFTNGSIYGVKDFAIYVYYRDAAHKNLRIQILEGTEQTSEMIRSTNESATLDKNTGTVTPQYPIRCYIPMDEDGNLTPGSFNHFTLTKLVIKEGSSALTAICYFEELDDPVEFGFYNQPINEQLVFDGVM